MLPDSSVPARSRPCMDDMRRGLLGCKRSFSRVWMGAFHRWNRMGGDVLSFAIRRMQQDECFAVVPFGCRLDFLHSRKERGEGRVGYDIPHGHAHRRATRDHARLDDRTLPPCILFRRNSGPRARDRLQTSHAIFPHACIGQSWHGASQSSWPRLAILAKFPTRVPHPAVTFRCGSQRIQNTRMWM